MFDLDLKDEANPLKTWPWPSSQIRANLAGLGICSSVFWANRSFFAKKWADEGFALKNEQLAHLLIFCERPERFAHGRSFLVSNLSNSLTSLVKKEGMSKSLGVFFNVQNTYKKIWMNESLVLTFLWVKERLSDLLNRSFIMRDLRAWLTVAHLSWATWAICSWSLFWYERPERFAHSCSFVLSDLSKSLTVAHLIWAIWANERIPSPGSSSICSIVGY